jgi:hypothetical protein
MSRVFVLPVIFLTPLRDLPSSVLDLGTVLCSFPNVLQAYVWIGLELCHSQSFQVLSGSPFTQ